MFDSLVLDNPKIHADSLGKRESRLFPYYAGYAGSFAVGAIKSLHLGPEAVILDPWNGSGTTTLAARQLGYWAIGQDLNPVMVLVAKASLLPKSESASLLPIAKAIVQRSPRKNALEKGDPLATWLQPSAALLLRGLETEVNRTLVCSDGYAAVTSGAPLEAASPLAALFYVALFRTARRLLVDFVPTNPTWVKTPNTPQARKRPGAARVFNVFLEEIEAMSSRLSISSTKPTNAQVAIRLGNAERLNLPDKSIDAVVTSPPYCTRIDYAVATSIELGILRLDRSGFDALRRTLMGTSTVQAASIPDTTKFGPACSAFLECLATHPSKASSTYYLKNHQQYFVSMHAAIREMHRVMRPGGRSLMVVQDSYYKELHNDVPSIAIEMATEAGFQFAGRRDFSSGRSMVGRNARAKVYLANRLTTESILCFVA